MTEVWDAYLGSGELADRDLIRGEKIPEGLFHLAVRILLRHSDGDYLVMRRAPAKKLYGGRLEATAGGSALKGESAEECALRELREETGISAEQLWHIGGFRTRDTIFEAYVATASADKDSVTLQEGETAEYRWVSEEELIRLLHSDEMIPTGRDCCLAHFCK